MPRGFILISMEGIMGSNMKKDELFSVIEKQVRRLDEIYKITCSPDDFKKWRRPGLSEDELSRLEARLGMQLPVEQRVSLSIFEFAIAPMYDLDVGFSDGPVPINNMDAASRFVVGDQELGRNMKSFFEVLPEGPRYYGPLRHVIWHDKTIWIGVDGTFYWFVDMNPPPGGTYGQIICVGFEEARVVASGYVGFLDIIIKSFPEDDFL